MNVQQMDLFDLMTTELPAADPEIRKTDPDDGLRRDPNGNRLNGCYYERSSGSFVSYALGARHWEDTGKGYPVEWKNRLKAERVIE